MGLNSILGPEDWFFYFTIMGLLMAMTMVTRPQVKALIFMLPIPFTVGTLLLGKPVGSSNLLGVGLLALFANSVRWFRERHQHPILPLITGSAAGYLVLSALIVPKLSHSKAAFWTLAALLFLVLVQQVLRKSHRQEDPRCDEVSGHRKRLIISGVVFVLMLLRHHLQGAMTMFPIVGVVVAYEFRDSLWYMSEKVAVFALCSIPMIATIYVLQERLGLPLAMVGGWIVYLFLLCLHGGNMLGASNLKWVREQRL